MSVRGQNIRKLEPKQDTHTLFLLLWPWPWPDDLHVRTWSSADIPVYKKMNFLRQSYRKLSYYRHADVHRQTLLRRRRAKCYVPQEKNHKVTIRRECTHWTDEILAFIEGRRVVNSWRKVTAASDTTRWCWHRTGLIWLKQYRAFWSPSAN